ncbi:alpha/beta fold hydrolase [Nocardia sp. BMG111209]|uniref:alpha/beta fold hydrolase n=1 Tax=Nocardia sp. BMG111209 TaxID=1160137 RepID=UPI000363E0A2|nr:alpha/beta hydrolase [Nocardia sp. BMG111209]
MPEVTVGAARIPYRVLGSGRPLVLVHGGSAGSKGWDAAAEVLAETRTVVLPDLSGSDAARDDGGELTVELLAGQVAAVISDLGLGAADVAGHSMGGSVVAALAARRPELVRSLVLVTAWTGRGDEYLRHALGLWRQLACDADAFARYSMLIAFSREHLESAGAAVVAELASGYRPVPGRLRQIDLALRLDVRDLLPRIDVPALVIGCSRDLLVSARYSRELAADIPGAAYAEIAGGHQVMIEQPAEFAKLVRDFGDRV